MCDPFTWPPPRCVSTILDTTTSSVSIQAFLRLRWLCMLWKRVWKIKYRKATLQLVSMVLSKDHCHVCWYISDMTSVMMSTERQQKERFQVYWLWEWIKLPFSRFTHIYTHYFWCGKAAAITQVLKASFNSKYCIMKCGIVASFAAYLGSPLFILTVGGYRIVWFSSISTTHFVFMSFSR